ncbi:hypothetical protein [Streptomyces sp. NRRL F-5135]|uniref:hypothetical protein n=1 Tax=Streptomyces sp. NRRL F-5135 TaxID=1463858 RepID=UPI0004CB4FBE|nr:hypothetical protein [Streptomyces sp. NRRL F-5135]
MATDTVPAAVPGPDDPPAGASSSPQSGLLASMLAPVDPARPAFDLAAPTASEATAGGPAPSTSDASSAAYHGDNETATKDGTAGRTIEKKGIWRAWLLAGAARWGKGGGAQNKRLDLAKTKAQARQVKETRQVTVNRSGGIPGKASAANGPGGKSLGNKSTGPGPVKDTRKSNGSPQKGSSGYSGANGASGAGGGSGRGSGGGGSSSGNSNGSPRPKNPKNGGDGGSPKLSKGHDGKAGASGPSSGGSGGGKNGAAGPAGAAGKDGSGTGGKGSGSGSTADGKSSNGPLSKGGTGEGGKPSDGPSGKAPGAKGGPGADGTPGKAGAAGPGGKSTGPSGSSKDSETGKTDPTGKTPPPGEHAEKGKPFSTRESREAGYRDGTRAARAVAHVKAYKDGVKDGWGDTSEAADRDKDRLDKAHASRKADLQGITQGQAVQIEDDDEPMEDPFMSQATPIQAQGIDAKKITLGEGFLKPSVTRGELRRFKDYEGRLEARIDGLSRIADATKILAAEAREQAGDCQKLAEEAKGVKGGEKVVGQLQKLADLAKAQADEANEVHKRAGKAHDFAKAVLSNVQTRYAPLYQAVVDSDETKTAELKFYADRGVTPSDTALAA